MISNVNFTGRKTLLTEGIGATAKAVDAIHTYVGAGTTVFPKVEDTFVKEVKAVKQAAKAVVKNIAAPKTQNAELSYAISHGKPKSELVGQFGENIDYRA